MLRHTAHISEDKINLNRDGLNAFNKNETVYVIDMNGTPLLPTTPVRARILLKNGKATVYSMIPFTIKLKRKVDKPVGTFEVGIDDGAKTVGISVKGNNHIVFAADVELRQDVHRKMVQRAICRRARRVRNLRHRKARFLNRVQKGWIPPTIRHKKEVVLRVINDIKKRLNIGTKAIIEQGQFDVSSMAAGRQLVGKEYQTSEYEGNNWRQKVLWRDHYTCQICGSKANLHVHHIIHKSKGGTNTVNNGITVCKGCHDDVHTGKVVIKKKVKSFIYPTHLQQGKWWIYSKLKEIFKTVEICYGWMTFNNRKALGLPKGHHFDSSAMLKCSNYKTLIYFIKPRRTKICENNPAKTCTEKKSFKHYDVIKAVHRTKGTVIGSVRSLKKTVITLRTPFNNNFAVSYKNSSLLQRMRGLVYIFEPVFYFGCLPKKKELITNVN